MHAEDELELNGQENDMVSKIDLFAPNGIRFPDNSGTMAMAAEVLPSAMAVVGSVVLSMVVDSTESESRKNLN